jgi:predicted DNA-binding transcriptional regulator YafY
MARTTRLLALLQILRGKSRPVTASALADELEVSERTLYRDIADLTAQGAPIYGEAGIGYVLRPGLFLPPLMLSEDETEAVVLGLRRSARRRGFGQSRCGRPRQDRGGAFARGAGGAPKSNRAAWAAWPGLSGQ